MAAMPADIPVATTAVVRRFRGKSRAPNFVYRGPVSVIRLELEVCDDRARRRLERQWVAVFRLRRALQRDAADRCRAYWAAHRERARDPKALRERLGLTRKGIESAAKAHVEASGWMRDHLTKAVGLHVADEVWETIGALAVVFTGLAGGDVVLPVRLPQGAAQWAHLTHFLADPTVWHKIDLVRVRDRRAPGGWRYYAHLLVHQAGYQSVATQARRAQIPGDRRAGIDANVSNLALASFPEPQPEQLVIDKVGCTTEQQQAAEKAHDGPGHGSAPWIGRGATPTPTNMVRRFVKRPGLLAAPTPGCRPNT
jgi:hypothetical protein